MDTGRGGCRLLMLVGAGEVRGSGLTVYVDEVDIRERLIHGEDVYGLFHW